MRFILPLFLFLASAPGLAQASKFDLDVQKKIAEATPAALPQLPTDGRIGSDARDAGLKGKVKSISSRHTDHTDPRYPRKMLTGEDFYNEGGNRVRSIDWDDIRPVGVTVYGYIDKMRVSRRGNIEYADCGKPALQSCVPVVHTLPTTSDSVKRDDRYEIRWAYKYDPQGRLAEEIHLNNSGDILTRTTYIYETNIRRSVRHYAAGPEPLALVTEILDPVHGNIDEEWLYDEDQKVNSVRKYTYKFDARGNWVEQHVTERSPSEKQAKPVSTTYRTITYFP